VKRLKFEENAEHKVDMDNESQEIIGRKSSYTIFVNHKKHGKKLGLQKHHKFCDMLQEK
jgi:hypothetical protein